MRTSTMRTKVKILQHGRLDANSFFSVNLEKQTENCTNNFEDPITILRTVLFRLDGNRKHEIFTLNQYANRLSYMRRAVDLRLF